MKDAVKSILIILLEIVIIAGLIFACIQIFPSSDSEEGRAAVEDIQQEAAEEDAEELGVDAEETEQEADEESGNSEETAETEETEAAEKDAE